MTSLIERLNERAHDFKTATDEGKNVAAPPASEEQIAAAENWLGFALLELLKQVYREVGNGGWGPGDGLPGIPKMGKEWEKPVAGLLPLCEWGSGIASFADCSRSETPVIRRDANMPKADAGERVPPEMRFRRANEVKEACWVECASLEEWLEAWAAGVALFYRAYGGGRELEDEEEDDEAEGEE